MDLISAEGSGNVQSMDLDSELCSEHKTLLRIITILLVDCHSKLSWLTQYHQGEGDLLARPGLVYISCQSTSNGHYEKAVLNLLNLIENKNTRCVEHGVWSTSCKCVKTNHSNVSNYNSCCFERHTNDKLSLTKF